MSRKKSCKTVTKKRNMKPKRGRRLSLEKNPQPEPVPNNSFQSNLPYNYLNNVSNDISKLLHAYQNGTPFVRDLIKNDCNLLMECSSCRSIFRSVYNFLMHKKMYCRQRFNPAAYVKNLETDGETSMVNKRRKIDEKGIEIPPPKPAKKNILNVIDSLAQKQHFGFEVDGLNMNDFYNEFDPDNNVLTSLRLEPLANTNIAVSQTLPGTSNESIAVVEEIRELEDALKGSTVWIRRDGKAVNLLPKNKYIRSGIRFRRFKCTKCDILFITRKQYRSHLRLKHAGSKLMHILHYTKDGLPHTRIMRARYIKTANVQPNITTVIEPPKSEAISEEQRRDEEDEAWIEDLEQDNDILMCGGCGRRFERKAALNSHTQTCQKRIAIKNQLAMNRLKRAAEDRVETRRAKQLKVENIETEKRDKLKVKKNKIGIQIRCDYNKEKKYGQVDATSTVTSFDVCEASSSEVAGCSKSVGKVPVTSKASTSGKSSNNSKVKSSAAAKSSVTKSVSSIKSTTLSKAAIAGKTGTSKVAHGSKTSNVAKATSLAKAVIPSAENTPPAKLPSPEKAPTPEKVVPTPKSPLTTKTSLADDPDPLVPTKSSIIPKSPVGAKIPAVADTTKHIRSTIISNDGIKNTDKLFDVNSPESTLLENPFNYDESDDSDNNGCPTPMTDEHEYSMKEICNIIGIPPKTRKFSEIPLSPIFRSDPVTDDDKESDTASLEFEVFEGPIKARIYKVTENCETWLKVKGTKDVPKPQTLDECMSKYIDENAYQCIPCNRRWANIYGLRAHMSCHFNWMRYHCQYCDYKSFDVNYMSVHLTEKHFDDDFVSTDYGWYEIPEDETIEQASTEFLPLDTTELYDSTKPKVLVNCEDTTPDKYFIPDKLANIITQTYKGQNNKRVKKAKKINKVKRRIEQDIDNDTTEKIDEEKGDDVKSVKNGDGDSSESDTTSSTEKDFKKILVSGQLAQEINDGKTIDGLDKQVMASRPVRNRVKTFNKDFIYDMAEIEKRTNYSKIEAESYRNGKANYRIEENHNIQSKDDLHA